MSIIFSNVYKTLRQKDKKTSIFANVDAEFEGDRITGVLAPPGAGKSTLISLASGKLRPDKGKVRRSSNVSFPVGGGGVFNGLLTARENIAFLCRVAGFDPKPILKFVIDFGELTTAIDRQFRMLNRDERTRVLFTSVYAIPYDFYLADEVIIGGRGSFRERCKTLVEERMKTAGFFIATSSPAVLKAYCNDFAIVNQGTISMVENNDVAEQLIGKARLREGGHLYLPAAVELMGGHSRFPGEPGEESLSFLTMIFALAACIPAFRPPVRHAACGFPVSQT